MMKPLFPSFLLAGFECSTPINRDFHRIDEIALTQHDRHVRDDYRRLRELGICAARDGVRWNLVDQSGKLDFASVVPFVEAAEDEGITVIWDLFHYGYPDDLDPFSDQFVERFERYCRAFARLLSRRSDAIPFYTPVNEISYFAWAGGDEGVFAPHTMGRGAELKRCLARASIAGMNAILEVDSRARFVHCEPLVRVVAPHDVPNLHGEAEYFNYHFVHEAWDMIAGTVAPELGGSPRHLDILGVNYYGYNQWEHTRPHQILAIEDTRRMRFSDLLLTLHRRYGRPMIIGETSSHGEFRPGWIREIGEECLDAMHRGVSLHGLTIYPIIDMFDWHTVHDRRPLSMGVWELRRADHDSELLERIAHEPTVRELCDLQERMAAWQTDLPLEAFLPAAGARR